MAELMIRPSWNDHLAVSDLLATTALAGLASDRRPIARLVVEAPIAMHRAQYAEAARESGTPMLVDPRTDLLQVQTDPAMAWAKLPYAQDSAWTERQLMNPFELTTLVRSAVDFQVQSGATAIVAPYFYAVDTDGAAFEASLNALESTARYMREARISLPLVAVLAASHRGFARQETFGDGIDRFARRALDLGPQMLAFALSPNGEGKEGQAKVHQLFTAAQRLKETGVMVVAWRQGFFGAGLVAAGLDSYETGMGGAEKTDFAQLHRNAKPKDRDTGSGGDSAPVYFEALGRSVPRRTATVLLDDRLARGLLVCRDARCCAHGATSMLSTDNRRQHNVRTRARVLRDLDQMPRMAWRLHQVAKNAYETALTTTKVNEILAGMGVKTQLPVAAHESLARVVELLSRDDKAKAA